MLDSSSAEHLQLPHAPDILFTPSDLAPFAKMVDLERFIKIPEAPATSSGPQSDPQPQQLMQHSPSAAAGSANAGAMPDAAASVQQVRQSVACINPGRMVRGCHAQLVIGLEASSDAAAVQQSTGHLIHCSTASGCRVKLMKAS